MKYIISVGIALQLVAIMPAVRAETAVPMPQSPTQPTAPRDSEPRPAAASNRARVNLEQRTSTKPDSVKRSLERDRLILERFLIKIIPPASN